MFSDRQGRVYEIRPNNEIHQVILPVDLHVIKVHVNPDHVKLTCKNKEVWFLHLDVDPEDPGLFNFRVSKTDLDISMIPGSLRDRKAIGPISFVINKDNELSGQAYVNLIREYIPNYTLDENYFTDAYKLDVCMRYLAVLNSQKYLFIFPNRQTINPDSHPMGIIPAPDNFKEGKICYGTIQKLFIHTRECNRELPEIKSPLTDENGSPLKIKQFKAYNYRLICVDDLDNLLVIDFDERFRFSMSRIEKGSNMGIVLHKDVFIEKSSGCRIS